MASNESDSWEAFRRAEQIEAPITTARPKTTAAIPSVGSVERLLSGNPLYTPPASPTLEAALHLGSGMAAFPFALASGLGGLLLPGERGQGARRMRETQEALTYQPRSEAGRKLSAIATAPMRAMGRLSEKAGQKAADITGSPIAGALTEATMQMAPALVAAAVRPTVMRGAEARQAKLTAEAPKQELLKEAQSEGYVVPSPSAAGRALSSIGGKDVLKQEMAAHNQQITNAIARREAKLAPDAPLTLENLDAATRAASEPYRQIGALSPTANSALEALQIARSEKRGWYLDHARTGRYPALKKAQKFEGEEKFWEGMLTEEAQKLGRPALLGQLKEARVQIAKNSQIERALTAAGDVDARAIGSMWEREPGRMTGGLATIGKFASSIGREVSRDISRVGVPGGQHGAAIESAVGGALGAQQGPKGMLLGAGVPLARIPARALAMSRAFQPKPRLAAGPYLPQMLTAQPGMYALTPGLGMLRPEDIWEETF